MFSFPQNTANLFNFRFIKIFEKYCNLLQNVNNIEGCCKSDFYSFIVSVKFNKINKITPKNERKTL